MSAIIQGKGDVFGPIGAVAGNIPVFDGTSGKIIKDGVSPAVLAALPRGYLFGLVLSNNVTDATNDIDIGGGECRDSTNAEDIRLLVSITKRLDALWVAGTNQGGLDTGAVAANTSYHVFVIKNPSTGQVDALFSASPTSPAMPSGYTVSRRVGSFHRAGTAIRGFVQLGDYFQFTSPANSHAGASNVQGGSFMAVLGGAGAGGGTGAIPSGLKFMVDLTTSIAHSAGNAGAYLYDPDTSVGLATISSMSTAGIQGYQRLSVWCNTSAQVRVQSGATVGTFTYSFCPVGYWDPRQDG